jgi:hypothetical protein
LTDGLVVDMWKNGGVLKAELFRMREAYNDFRL